MIFTRRFFLLLALGIVPLIIFWSWAPMKWLLAIYDLLLIGAAWIDRRRMEAATVLEITRRLPRRLMINAENEVRISVAHRPQRQFTVIVKDEFPPELELRGEREIRLQPQRGGVTAVYQLFARARGDYHFGDLLVRWPGRWGLAIKQARIPASTVVKVYPNIREAKKQELFAKRNRQLMSGLRRTRVRGQGKEFESLRDYVRGDELRNVSWTATARRGRLMTKQYQVERNQSIVVLLDAGRLMTSRIGDLSKLDHAIQATLAIGYVATHGGDNFGLLVFARQVLNYLPPQRGTAQMQKLIEALYNVKPQMIEPSYARAFQSFALHCKRRSLVIILTDLVDADASAELLAYTATLLPRHLPLIVTIGDNDLRALVAEKPRETSDVYRQSVAEEMLRQREEALARITELGGLALDLPAGELSMQLVNKYLEVKERGLL
jgi:uncharacterized protein (DUF58 family)